MEFIGVDRYEYETSQDLTNTEMVNNLLGKGKLKKAVKKVGKVAGGAVRGGLSVATLPARAIGRGTRLAVSKKARAEKAPFKIIDTKKGALKRSAKDLGAAAAVAGTIATGGLLGAKIGAAGLGAKTALAKKAPSSGGGLLSKIKKVGGKKVVPTTISKIKEKAENLGQKPLIKKVVSDLGRQKSVANIAVKSPAKEIALAPLIPLKGMMVSTLKKKGLQASKSESIENVANKFYNNVVVPAEKGTMFEVQAFDINNFTRDHADNIAWPVIAAAILEYIKRVRANKEAGVEQSEINETVAEGVEKAEAAIIAGAKDEAAQTLGEKLMQNWWIIAAVFAGVLLIAFKK